MTVNIGQCKKIKKLLLMKKQIKFQLLFLICFSLSGCYSPKIVVKEDIVFSTRRIELEYLCWDEDNRSPLINLEQSIVKEINRDETTIKVYDKLTMKSSGFKLEAKVFMIVDNKVYTMTIDYIEYEHAKNMIENTEEILQSDSTKVSVVTGYSESNKKITRFSYKLSDDLISSIKNSNEVIFRYYAGPSMLTVKLKNKQLIKLKELIDMV